jgi:hypothetical protein
MMKALYIAAALVVVGAILLLYQRGGGGLLTVAGVAYVVWRARGLAKIQATYALPGSDRRFGYTQPLLLVGAAVLTFVLAMSWIAVGSRLTYRGVIPDTWLGALVVYGPPLVMLIGVMIILWRAYTAFTQGTKS